MRNTESRERDVSLHGHDLSQDGVRNVGEDRSFEKVLQTSFGQAIAFRSDQQVNLVQLGAILEKFLNLKITNKGKLNKRRFNN